MPSGEQRALALAINFAINGVPVTIHRQFPDNAPVQTSGIWRLPADEGQPFGVDLKRRSPRRVLALPKLAGSQAQKGAVIEAPEHGTSDVLTWVADGFASAIEPEVVDVFVVRKSE
jgi:hypothetical protein